MNPLDLPGPEFLIFYVLLTAAVAGAYLFARARIEQHPLPGLHDLDPYALAMLRAGPGEAACVTAVALLDRGLLRLDGDRLVAMTGSEMQVRRSFERAVLRHFRTPLAGTSVFRDANLALSAAPLADELVQRGLVPNPAQKMFREAASVGAVVGLVAFGLVKVVVASASGHNNVGFLWLLMFLVAALFMVIGKRRTAAGDEALKSVQTLCAGLRARAGTLVLGSGSFDLTLLIGAFGLDALAADARAMVEKAFPRLGQAQSTFVLGGGSGCGSSCGGGGGGDGGGGGCGGCGGGGGGG